jgi:hypothetical protein
MPANPEEAYLVRGADGRMRTVMAFSIDGAKRAYLRTRPKRGTSFSIKLRNGSAGWTHFNVV